MYNVQILRSEDCVDNIYLDGSGDWTVHTKDDNPVGLEYESGEGVLIQLSLEEGTVLNIHNNDDDSLPTGLEEAYEITD